MQTENAKLIADAMRNNPNAMMAAGRFKRVINSKVCFCGVGLVAENKGMLEKLLEDYTFTDELGFIHEESRMLEIYTPFDRFMTENFGVSTPAHEVLPAFERYFGLSQYLSELHRQRDSLLKFLRESK